MESMTLAELDCLIGNGFCQMVFENYRWMLSTICSFVDFATIRYSHVYGVKVKKKKAWVGGGEPISKQTKQRLSGAGAAHGVSSSGDLGTIKQTFSGQLQKLIFRISSPDI